MDTYKSKMNDMERECAAMRQEIQRLNKTKEELSRWDFNFMSNFGCKFKSQVYESQERNIFFGQSLDGRSIKATRSSRHQHNSSTTQAQPTNIYFTQQKFVSKMPDNPCQTLFIYPTSDSL